MRFTMHKIVDFSMYTPKTIFHGLILSNTTRHVARLITLKTWKKWARYYLFCYGLSITFNVHTALTVSAESRRQVALV